MSKSGIGMILGQVSVDMFYAIGIGIILLGVLFYGLRRDGSLRPNEQARLDRNTQAQERDDPLKRTDG
jgi:hypothetical protein